MANFCVHFSKNFKYLDSVSQVIVPYRRSKHIIQELCRTQKFTVVINLITESETQQRDIKLWENLFKKYKNIKVRVPFQKRDLWMNLGARGIPYFFSNSVSSFGVLETIATKFEHPPCDIVVSGFLSYNFRKVAEYAHNHNLNVRVIPNIAQSELAKETQSIKSFFITPEMIELYEPFVDTFELYSNNIIQNNNAVFEIYGIEKKFRGPLNAIIIGLQPLGENALLGLLLSPKMSCGYRCLLQDDCHVCSIVKDYLKAHSNNDLTD